MTQMTQEEVLGVSQVGRCVRNTPGGDSWEEVLRVRQVGDDVRDKADKLGTLQAHSLHGNVFQSSTMA